MECNTRGVADTYSYGAIGFTPYVIRLCVCTAMYILIVLLLETFC